MIRNAYYCQKCMTANKLSQDTCSQCGTTLMLIVESPSSRFDTGLSSIKGQEFLLERVSWLELRLLQLAERMEHTLDLMLKQSNNLFMDHTLIDAIVTLLIKKGLIEGTEVHDLWHANRDHKNEKRESQKQLDALRDDWLADHKGEHKDKFTQLINEAISALYAASMSGGIKKLEQAAALSVENVSLNLFLALTHLRDNRIAIARDYIRRAYEKQKGNARIQLLYSLILCEEGEIQEAKPLLQRLTRKKERRFAAHYGLGCLLVLEDKWPESLMQFKKALALRPMPEAHYLVASACYFLERFTLAEKHLRLALQTDGDYVEAIYLLGLTLARQGDIEQAKECFRQTLTLDDEKRYQSALRNTKRLSQNTIIPPLFAKSRLAKKLLLINGDKRLAKLVWKDIVGSE